MGKYSVKIRCTMTQFLAADARICHWNSDRWLRGLQRFLTGKGYGGGRKSSCPYNEPSTLWFKQLTMLMYMLKMSPAEFGLVELLLGFRGPVLLILHELYIFIWQQVIYQIGKLQFNSRLFNSFILPCLPVVTYAFSKLKKMAIAWSFFL